jgi:polyisoprenoid-binding protein YceI
MILRLPLLLAALAGPAAAFAASQPLIISPADSTVQIDISATLDSFTAKFQDFDAAIALDPSQGEVKSATVKFVFSHLKTGDNERDEAMYEWENIKEYPGGEFTLDSVELKDSGQFVAHGHLEFHGVSRPVTFPFDVDISGTTLTIEGQAPLDTRDYGLPIFRKFLVLKVDPVVQVRFHLVGKLAGK